MTEPVTVRLLHVPAGHIMPPAPLIAAVRLARSRAKVCAGLRAGSPPPGWRAVYFAPAARSRSKPATKKGWYHYQPLLSLGAEGESRTPTPLPELDPEPSVSTNSTTSAQQKCIYAISAHLASIFCLPFPFCGN